jgi:acyl-coenzyme A synthetase/AMP-(fatty) acid ligase
VEVGAAIAESAGAYLVSTPAHLRRLAGSPAALHGAVSSCRAVFSSGGPLDARSARTLAGVLGHAPIEVFGSTETGGIAWRQQTEEQPAPWIPFDEVEIATTDEGRRLHVTSPWIGEPGGVFTMGDTAEIAPDGRFVLGQRADRVVKIGERRLALPEMEARLHEHPFVETAALVPLERRGEERLGAIVVLTDEGGGALAGSGRRALALALRRWLAAHWDGVLLPRAWRFVDRLPEDAQGKASMAALGALFR